MYTIENQAIETGGGLHAANSTLIIDGMLQCVNNEWRRTWLGEKC